MIEINLTHAKETEFTDEELQKISYLSPIFHGNYGKKEDEKGFAQFRKYKVHDETLFAVEIWEHLWDTEDRCYFDCCYGKLYCFEVSELDRTVQLLRDNLLLYM